MHRWSPLNDRQRELLRRLDASEELGSASAERLSMYALRDRGLLVVVRRHGAVQTEVTDAGRFYLEHGHHPEDPRYTSALQGAAKKTPMPYSERPVVRARRAMAAELIERLVAERRVVIPAPDEAMETEYRRATQWLLLSRKTSRLAVPAVLRGRALRLLQALSAEAAKRGHEVREHAVAEPYRSRPYAYGGTYLPSRLSRREGELDLVVGYFTYTVTIKQEYSQSADPERAQSLMIELPCSRSGRQGKWVDRKRWRLEDVLGTILREVEIRAGEDAQRRIDEERAKADRKVRLQAAMDSAREQAIQAQLAAVLRVQAKDWHEARALSQYCDALEHRLAASAGLVCPEAASARQWLEWARAYVRSLDPLRELPAMPRPATRSPRN
ncbi:hypothetical protein [Streptomyces sp. ISL-94]|uniref:hypothetical protein n=1 Tax=Streptomyces sp. ISL-94 TaxID=2819190 RepID=UPI002035A56E|nr:hypothetical protein [Streptomyces sp. ISL-94]